MRKYQSQNDIARLTTNNQKHSQLVSTMKNSVIYVEQLRQHGLDNDNSKPIPSNNCPATNNQQNNAMDQSISLTTEITPNIQEFVDFQPLPFDVPKLGVVNHYKPPEVEYNEMFEDKTTKSSELKTAPERFHIQPTSPPFLPTPYQPNRTMSKTRNLSKMTKRKVWGRKIKSHRKSNRYIKDNCFLRSHTEQTKKKEILSLKPAKPEKQSKEGELHHIENTLYALVQNELLFQDNYV